MRDLLAGLVPGLPDTLRDRIREASEASNSSRVGVSMP